MKIEIIDVSILYTTMIQLALKLGPIVIGVGFLVLILRLLSRKNKGKKSTYRKKRSFKLEPVLKNESYTSRFKPRLGNEDYSVRLEPHFGDENSFSNNYSRRENKEFFAKEDKQNERIKNILNTDFRVARLMNKSEFSVFCFLEKLLSEKHKEQNYRLFSQVGLGGFISPPKELELCSQEEKDAFWSINHLRADFLIIDKFGKPALVIEYQGDGHRRSNSTDRDVRKRYACQKIGVELVEIFKHSENFESEKISLLLNTYYDRMYKK